MKRTLWTIALALMPSTALAGGTDDLQNGDRVIDEKGHTAIVLAGNPDGSAWLRLEPIPWPRRVDSSKLARLKGCGRTLCVEDWFQYSGGDRSGQVVGVRPDGQLATIEAGHFQKSPTFQYVPEEGLRSAQKCPPSGPCLDEEIYLPRTVTHGDFMDAGWVASFSAETGIAVVHSPLAWGPVKMGREGYVSQTVEVPLEQLGRTYGCGAYFRAGEEIVRGDGREYTVEGVYGDGRVFVSNSRRNERGFRGDLIEESVLADELHRRPLDVDEPACRPSNDPLKTREIWALHYFVEP